MLCTRICTTWLHGFPESKELQTLAEKARLALQIVDLDVTDDASVRLEAVPGTVNQHGINSCSSWLSPS